MTPHTPLSRTLATTLLAAATAHFETRKPIDRLAAVTGAGEQPSMVQVNTGKGQRVAGRDYIERGKRKP